MSHLHRRLAGGVVEVSWLEFADGQEVTVEGYPGHLPWRIVLERAKSHLGRSYDPVVFNCEHFYVEAHNLPRKSPQLRLTSIVLGATAMLLAYLGTETT